jgi:SHS2 domain-containing protein
MRRYRVIAHTADTGIVARGHTLAEALENAAYGMFDLMFDLRRVGAGEECAVEVKGENTDELLVAWLSALLAEAEIRGMAFSHFTVQAVGEGSLRGTASGAPAAGLELRGPPVEAVTFHDLAVEQVLGGWQARVIFDV